MFEAASIEYGYTDLANYFFKLLRKNPSKKSENWKYRIFLFATFFVGNINQFGIERFDHQI